MTRGIGLRTMARMTRRRLLGRRRAGARSGRARPAQATRRSPSAWRARSRCRTSRRPAPAAVALDLQTGEPCLRAARRRCAPARVEREARRRLRGAGRARARLPHRDATCSAAASRTGPSGGGASCSRATAIRRSRAPTSPRSRGRCARAGIRTRDGRRLRRRVVLRHAPDRARLEVVVLHRTSARRSRR